MREIIFDTETTGLSPDKGDRLVEIGCIEMVDRCLTGRSFHAYYNPQCPMPAQAEEIHGLSDAFLSNKPLFADGVEELLDFLEDSVLVAHNARFDQGFLNMELRLCGRPHVEDARILDTIAIAKSRHPGAGHSLDALCVRYGIDRSHRVKHGALLDAELLAQLYIELTGGRQIGLGLAEDTDSSAAVLVSSSPAAPREPLAPRPHAPSAKELAAHAEFVGGIADSLWPAPAKA